MEGRRRRVQRRKGEENVVDVMDCREANQRWRGQRASTARGRGHTLTSAGNGHGARSKTMRGEWAAGITGCCVC